MGQKKLRRSGVSWVATGILAVLLAAPTLADVTVPARVIDGDTLDIAGERIRLHGIDAPESEQTCVADGVTWPCGQSATAALRSGFATRASLSGKAFMDGRSRSHGGVERGDLCRVCMAETLG